MKQVMVVISALALGAALSSDAQANKPYASAGVVELGGETSLSYSSQSFTADGADESTSTSTTSIDLGPVIGYFIIPSLELFGSLQFQYEKESPEDGEDTNTTGFGALLGAGYYIPAGTVFVGPRAAVGYATVTLDNGTIESKASGLVAQAAGALRVPFGWGGLLDVAAVVQYQKFGIDIDDSAFGDVSSLQFGAEIGFFVFF